MGSFVSLANISGTSSTSVPKLIATMMRMIIRPTFFSTFSCFMGQAPQAALADGAGACAGASLRVVM